MGVAPFANFDPTKDDWWLDTMHIEYNMCMHWQSLKSSLPTVSKLLLINNCINWFLLALANILKLMSFRAEITVTEYKHHSKCTQVVAYKVESDNTCILNAHERKHPLQHSIYTIYWMRICTYIMNVCEIHLLINLAKDAQKGLNWIEDNSVVSYTIEDNSVVSHAYTVIHIQVWNSSISL